MSVLIKASDLSKIIGGKLLFDNATFNICDNNCIGLLGPNGCGKTTLFKILLGWEKQTYGDIWRKENLQIRYLDQVAINPQDKTIRDFLLRTTQPDSIQKQIEAYEKQLEDPSIYSSPRYADILEKIRNLKLSASQKTLNKKWEVADSILSGIDMKNLSLDMQIDTLSGGERQKIALASIFSQSSDCELLLLDEPTNHLDIDTIEWLERQIVDFPHAVFIISHDRYLLDDLVDSVFDFQGSTIEIFNATFEEFEEQKKLRQHIQTKAAEKSKAERKRQMAVIETMTRRNRYDRQIASKIKRLEKKQKVGDSVLKSYLLKFRFKTIFKSGKNVADGSNISKRFDDKIILINANFEIFAGQKIGLIGPNGCGKTTFLKMLTREEKPDGGSIHISSGVNLGYFDQGHLSLNYENNLIDEVRRDQKDISENDAKALLGQFNFKGNVVFNKVDMLSGGERARLAILRLIMQPYNFLVLDEPTNHMDMDSKVAIERAINAYAGTVIAVSHDRRFLDMATDTIFFMDNDTINTYNGNYSNFKLQRQKELIQISDARNAPKYLPGTEKYVVCKTFTNWTTQTKHKVGEKIFIGDHNREIYEYAINGKFIKPVNEKARK